jgi:hypothetical protein
MIPPSKRTGNVRSSVFFKYTVQYNFHQILSQNLWTISRAFHKIKSAANMHATRVLSSTAVPVSHYVPTLVVRRLSVRGHVRPRGGSQPPQPLCSIVGR